MRRSDRRAIVFICVAILAFWGGMLLERQLSSRADRGLMNLDESLIPTSPESGEEAFGLDAEAITNGLNTQPLPSLTGEDGGRSFFDPNLADSVTLIAMGFEPWQTHNILKYRARGGHFRRTEDLKRLYGMTPDLYTRVAPYVKIDKRYLPYDEDEYNGGRARREAAREARERLYEQRQLEREARDVARRDSLAKRYPRQEKFEELVQLDLNSVDTATLKRVPGIASYRARQIVRYRERLGGFVSTAQLQEIEGFPADELEAWFKVEGDKVRHIDVNKASVQEMGRHPYIGFTRARAIENYRRNQGAIHSLEDLSLLPDFTPEAIRKIEDYVKY